MRKNHPNNAAKKKYEEQKEILKTIFLEHTGMLPTSNDINQLFSESYGINDLQVKYISHLYAITTITTAARASELHYLKLSDFNKITDEYTQYQSYIRKTADGRPTIREIASWVYELIQYFIEIGLTSREEEGVQLFYRLDATKMQDIQATAQCFDRSYQYFLNSLSETLREEIILQMPCVSSHMGRQSFVSFALRVSDGNVSEKIRRLLRHDICARWMFTDYTEYKLSPEQQEFLEREYIKEIISKIISKKYINGEEHYYFGAMLSRIEKLIDENINFISEDEVEDEINRLGDMIEKIKIHEYGFCLPVTETITKSKCYNKRTKIPEYDKASSFSSCTKCIHLLSSTGCREDIERIGLYLHQVLEKPRFLTNSLRKKYIKELKVVVRMIKEIDKIKDDCDEE